MTVGGDAFPMHVKNLPTLVESYKTYDDVHIVKSNDIGQACCPSSSPNSWSAPGRWHGAEIDSVNQPDAALTEAGERERRITL